MHPKYFNTVLGKKAKKSIQSRYLKLRCYKMKKNKLTKKIYIIGAGKLGILASEIIKRQGKFRIIGFVESDNRKIGKLINNIKVFSDGDVFKKNKPSNINIALQL